MPEPIGSFAVQRPAGNGRTQYLILPPGVKKPKHVIDVTRQSQSAFQVGVWFGGGTPETGRKMVQSFQVLIATWDDIAGTPKTAGGPSMPNPAKDNLVSLWKLKASTMEEMRDILEDDPTLIFFAIESAEDLAIATMIQEAKEQTHACAKVVFIGGKEYKAQLNKSLYLDYFDIEAANKELIGTKIWGSRLPTKMKEAIELWHRGKLRKELVLDRAAFDLRLVHARDRYTASHCQEVTGLVMLLAQALKLRGEELYRAIAAARMHDVGKLATPDSILLKPGKLTPQEFLLMQLHAPQAYVLLARGEDPAIAKAVLHHHERMDGTGYPEGVFLGDFPLYERIIPPADVLNALLAERPYKRPLSIETAIKIIKEGANAQFDPQVAEALVTMVEEGIEITYDDLSSAANSALGELHLKPELSSLLQQLSSQPEAHT